MQKRISTSEPDFQNRYKQIESRTVTGLLLMLIAGILMIISLFRNFSLYSFSGLRSNSIIIGLAGPILAFIGFLQIYKDRRSYPEPHPTSMKRALILYIIGIGFYFSYFIILSLFMFSIHDQSFLDTLRILYYLSLILMTIGPSFLIVGNYIVLSSLIPRSRMIFIRLAIIVFLISIFLIVFQLTMLLTHSYDPYYMISGISREVAILVHILFVICFFFAYDHQKRNPQLRIEEEKYY